MITEIKISNFKMLGDVKVPLSPVTVFVGPNNGGKTTVLQALAVWQLAVRKWAARRQTKDNGSKRKAPAKRPGVGVNVQEFIFLQLSQVYELWRDLLVYEEQNRPSLIEINVKGMKASETWECGMSFQFADAGQVLVRPLKTSDANTPSIPQQALDELIVSMTAIHSMLGREELQLQPEAIDFLVATGKIGDGLRNMLYYLDGGQEESSESWKELSETITKLFSVELLRPIRLPNSELQVQYRNIGKDKRGKAKGEMNLNTAGSGFLQTLLLLTLFYSRKATVFLLDEPEAHLETIRQQQIFRLIKDRAEEKGIQVIMASHSEKFMEEAIDTDGTSQTLIALIEGQPRLLSTQNDKTLTRKSLTQIPASDYYDSARRYAWVYVEDYTDIEILTAWAITLRHQFVKLLDNTNVHYLRTNDLSSAMGHFQGLKFVYPKLKGVAVIDRVDRTPNPNSPLTEYHWKRREIENYLLVWPAIERTFWSEAERNKDWDTVNSLGLFRQAHSNDLQNILTTNYLVPRALTVPDHPDLVNRKGSDDVLVPFFKEVFAKFGIYNSLPKNKLHKVAQSMNIDEIHEDVVTMLDDVVRALLS